MDDFESFTREKIARLRAEADALEKILKEFQATQARLAGAARRSGGDQPRSGAFGVIMDAIAGSGVDGLTLDQMIAAAEAEGYLVKRPTLRSQVWQATKDGQLTQLEPGRYRSSVVDDFEDISALAPKQPAREIAPGVEGRKVTGPREDFSADLDDEIPF